MATTDAKFSVSEKIFIKNVEEFEMNIKKKLKWTKNQWIASGECGSRENKLCNSLNFWKGKLKPAIEDSSVVLTIFNTEKDVKTDLAEIIDAIEKLEGNVSVCGFSDFRNPRYLCIYLANKAERDIVLKNFRMLEGNNVVFMSWALEDGTNQAFLKVHWLPMTLDINVIKKELDKYVVCIQEEKKILKLMSGRNVPSGKVSFKVSVKKGVDVENIPHLMQIAGMEALITISGRLPLCLNCDKLGHISKECQFRFCARCNALQLKEHACKLRGDIPSYANVVKNNALAVDADDWNSAIEFEEKENTEQAKGVLSDRIINLENQLLTLQNQEILSNEQRADKRKVSGEHVFVGTEKVMSGTNIDDSVEMGSHSSDDSDSIEGVEELDGNAGGKELSKNEKPKKNKKSRSSRNKKSQSFKPKNIIDKGVVSVSSEAYSLRSYGKPVLNNVRRVREMEKFDKIVDKREFVFDD